MKKAQIGDVLSIVFILLVVIGAIYGINLLIKSLEQYNQYKTFCNNHTSFCYCDWGQCEFKISLMSSSSYSCIDNNCTEPAYSNITLSKDTQDLCALAKSMNDKKMLFKAGCP